MKVANLNLLPDEVLVRLMYAAPDAIVSVDVEGTIVMVNDHAERLFGHRRASLLGTSILPILPLDLGTMTQNTAGVLLTARHRDGRAFPVELSLSTMDAEPTSITTLIVRDVSVRSEIDAERVRVKSEAERVRLSVEAVRVIAEDEKAVAEDVRLEAQVQLVIAEGEKAVAEDVRLEAEVQLVRAKAEKAVAEDVRQEAEVQLVKAQAEKAEAEQVRLEAEVQRVLAESEKTEAERVRLAAEVQLVKAQAEKAEAERVRLEAEIQLERLEGQLHQSQRMESLGQLAGGVAHDFNNLLAVILNYAAFVTEELSLAVAAPEGDRWEGPLKDVSQIQVAAERASVLTHQLLAFARKEVIQARPLSINDAIRNIEAILRRTIGEQIELTTSLEPELAAVIADPGHIEQIILNLAINARDAMPGGGTLVIETSTRNITVDEFMNFGVTAGSYICIRISDNGTGMPKDISERAFEPFFTTKPRGEGSGLGLATVYGIVRQTGGHTKIYSDEGIGTTVTVLLPVADLHDDAARREEVVACSLVGTETVLVVDDEEGLREVARRILTRNGYQVMVANGGEEAMALASSFEGHIDLLLTDVIMPKMQGPTVAKEIKKILPDVRVLFMSGHAQPVLEAEEVLGTKFQLVEKPFDQKLLLEHVRRALDGDVHAPLD